MQAPFADPLLRAEQLRIPLPLVGRDSEMQMVRALLDTVTLDLPMSARALTISGEVGVGKTRLLAELCSEARGRGFRILEASTYESGKMFPYFPFIEALRPVLRSSTPEQLRHYVGLSAFPSQQDGSKEQDATHGAVMALTGMPVVTALTRLFPELPAMLHIGLSTASAPEILSSDQEKFRLLDAVATLLERMSLEQPILLCIDNLQWADSASLELMLYLTVRLRSSCVALVGATRPPRMPAEQGESDDSTGTAATAAATKALSNLVRQGMLLFLPLGPLREDAAVQHLRTLLPGTLAQSVIQALLMRAEGNPFFLEELVRTLTLNQHLVLREGGWQVMGVSSTKLPDSIRLAVSQRLQGLSKACRELLQVASLFGRTFSVDALIQVVEKSQEVGGKLDGRKDAGVQALIDEAVDAAVIAKAPPLDDYADDAGEPGKGAHLPVTSPMYTFCQGIVQEVLHNEVPSQRARTLHGEIGKALEAVYGSDAPQHAAELARHYALSGEREATLHWTLLAGEDAMQQQAHREAISHFRLVLKLVEGAEFTTISIAELHLTLGELWSKLGELQQATSAFQQALQQLQQGGPRLLLARANRLLADVYRMQTRYDQALAHLQAAQTALDQGGHMNKEVGDDSSEVTQVAWFLGRSFSSGSARLEQVSAAERILFLQSQATLDLLLNRPKEAESALWRSHQVATELGDQGSQAFALHLIGWIRGWGEQTYEAIRLLEQAHDLYVAIGDPFRAASGDHALGSIYQTVGEMEKARLYTLRGMERARRYGVRRILGWLHWNQGVMALAQGNWESCTAHLQQALQEALVNDDDRLKPLVMQAQAELHFRRGSWREGEQLFLDSIQAAARTEWFPSTVALYGHFLAVTGRRTAARVQLDRAAELPELPGISGGFYIPFLAEGYLHLDAPERATTSLPASSPGASTRPSRASAYLKRIRNLRGFMYYGNAVDRILGEVAMTEGDWETAERAFEDGLLLCQRANNEPEMASILYEQARAALMHGDTSLRIHELCDRARALFLRYGMQRAADMVDTLQEGARQLEQQKAQSSSSIATRTTVQGQRTGYVLDLHLTKREIEVLRLVAEGHTDREVAETLVISPRTVNRHLSNIFVKLDVPGRAAAVAYATRRGLV